MTEKRIGEFRIGQGFDIHPWSTDPARKFTLGGVVFDGVPGLVGHSDADVAAHACTDAILGACALGDIGTMFPDTDEEHKGADSIEMLRLATAHINEAGWLVGNVDCTVILDKPKLSPHRSTMVENLARAVQAPVSIKGKRTEGVASLQDGVQCLAIALVVRADL